MLKWNVKTFKQLTLDELYDALKLRIDVFVVEQTCYYPDIDNLDRHPETLHIFGYKNDKMAAYLRVLPKGTSYPDNPSIGRVIIESSARGTGLAHQLMDKTLIECKKRFPDQTFKMSAQEHLETFYSRHGFTKCSEMYLEDGIPHISMIQNSNQT